MESDGTPPVMSELVTTKQAAAIAGVGERTWWRWTRSGLAPAPVKIGIGPRPAVRFKRSEILEWIRNGCEPVDGNGGGPQ